MSALGVICALGGGCAFFSLIVYAHIFDWRERDEERDYEAIWEALRKHQ